jgi:hypothetical protein
MNSSSSARSARSSSRQSARPSARSSARSSARQSARSSSRSSARQSVESIVDKSSLRIGERYTFYLTNGYIRRGTFDGYLSWGGVPDAGIRISNYSTKQLGARKRFVDEHGTVTLPLNTVTEVTQIDIGRLNSDVSRIINGFVGGRKSRKVKTRRFTT